MNNDVDMSSPIVLGMQYKNFFGLHGSLPLAFTDRILRNSKQEDVFDFFDNLFAKLITNRENKYYKITHSYIKLFKLHQNQEKNLKLINIDKRFNSIGKSKLGNFILGKKGF